MVTEVQAKFALDAEPALVWTALTNPEVVATCLPGGELLQVIDDRSFRGAVSASLGPFRVRFEGDARFETLDREGGRAVLSIDAAETGGRARGSMRMSSRVEAAASGTAVFIEQTLGLDGPLGRFVPPPILAEATRYALGRFEKELRRVLAAGEP